jgi:hypothetical protein
MKTQIKLLIIYIISSLNYLFKCESITVSNIEIKWTNLGIQTNFQISSSLGNGLLPSNAWLAFGFNSQMVILIIIINFIFILFILK